MEETIEFNKWADKLPPVKDFKKLSEIDERWEFYKLNYLAKERIIKNES